MDRFDIAVIGTGPAGMEAAITAKVRNKNVLLLGSTKSNDKVANAHTIKNYLGLPEVSGEKMQEAFLNHLETMGLEITDDKVNAVYAMGDYFAIQGHKEMYEASSVILATGISAVKPYPGEEANLGRGVSYCATCDAALYRGRTAIVVSDSPEEEKEAEFLAEIADKVYYLPTYAENPELNEKIQVVLGAKPLEIQRTEGKMQLVTNGKTLEADGIFILRKNVAPSQLVQGLTIENNRVPVDLDMKTNIPGLFACGDITGAPYQYIKAAGQGNVAALSAVNYLVSKCDKVK